MSSLLLFINLQGKYDEAEPLNRRSLAMVKQTQGSEMLAARIDLPLTLQGQMMLVSMETSNHKALILSGV